MSEKCVLRIMRKLGLAGKGATRKHRIQKKVEPGDPRLNMVERAFAVGERNRLWVRDITYIPTREGRLYLAAVIDAFSRKVVGRSMSERINEKVAVDAIGQAVGKTGPPDDGSPVFHDDQGAQHTSRSFRRCLDSHGIVRSVSRPGTPLDNAAAESFFKTPQRELTEERSYGTKDATKQEIFKYIELYYNRVRMHSTLGYMSPVEYERQYARGSLKESPVHPSHSTLIMAPFLGHQEMGPGYSWNWRYPPNGQRLRSGRLPLLHVAEYFRKRPVLRNEYNQRARYHRVADNIVVVEQGDRD